MGSVFKEKFVRAEKNAVQPLFRMCSSADKNVNSSSGHESFELHFFIVKWRHDEVGYFSARLGKMQQLVIFFIHLQGWSLHSNSDPLRTQKGSDYSCPIVCL